MPRPSVTTDKAIDLAQLDAELGGHGLCRNEETGEIVAATDSPVTQQQLADAIAAHIPPDITPPVPVDDRIDALTEALGTISTSLMTMMMGGTDV